MQLLDLNLASRPFKNNTLLWVGYAAASVLLLALSIWNVATYRDYKIRLSQLTTTVQDIEQENEELDQRASRARSGAQRYDLDVLAPQVAKANEVIEWRAFSWTRLFNRIAEIQPFGVKMISIRPVFYGGARSETVFTEEGRAESVPVLVEGVARDFSALWEFQNALIEAANFGRVDPQRLNRSETNEIIFQMRFVYYPDETLAPDEAAVEQVVIDGADAPRDELDEQTAGAEESASETGKILRGAGDDSTEGPRRKLPPVSAEAEEQRP